MLTLIFISSVLPSGRHWVLHGTLLGIHGVYRPWYSPQLLPTTSLVFSEVGPLVLLQLTITITFYDLDSAVGQSSVPRSHRVSS